VRRKLKREPLSVDSRPLKVEPARAAPDGPLLRCPRCTLAATASERAHREKTGFVCEIAECPRAFELIEMRTFPGWARPGPGRRGSAMPGEERAE
jgi:hypothetical protein